MLVPPPLPLAAACSAASFSTPSGLSSSMRARMCFESQTYEYEPSFPIRVDSEWCGGGGAFERRPTAIRHGGIALLPLAHRRRCVEPQSRDDRVQRELGLDVNDVPLINVRLVIVFIILSLGLDVVVHEEGLRDRRGVGEA